MVGVAVAPVAVLPAGVAVVPVVIQAVTFASECSSGSMRTATASSNPTRRRDERAVLLNGWLEMPDLNRGVLFRLVDSSAAIRMIAHAVARIRETENARIAVAVKKTNTQSFLALATRRSRGLV